MNSVCRDIFRAIHEGKWLKIEYKNKEDRVTSYWIGIQNINLSLKALNVEGLHLGKYTVSHLDIYIDSIISSQVIEGSYCEINKELVNDISVNPHKYLNIFDHVANLKILTYLEMCNRMDTVPYYDNFKLVQYFDREKLSGDMYALSEEQFRYVVNNFQYRANKERETAKGKGKIRMQQLAVNILSINTSKGLYVLAYRKLNFDVKNRTLRPDKEITICTQYSIGGKVESIRRYLDAEDYDLLKNFEKNQEKIKDCIMEYSRKKAVIDDLPYMIGIGSDVILDLHKEYNAIIKMYDSGDVTFPIKAFFGDLLERPRRTKGYPIALLKQKTNLDQVLASNNAMKFPISYVQGPPGTGKTNTIINTIATAFFNNRTVLFASYNNIPIDGVFKKLSNLEYRGKIVPFPVLRLGNEEKMRDAIRYIKLLYKRTQGITIFEATLDRRKEDRIERAKKLSGLLKKYEESLDYSERKETVLRMMESQEEFGASINMLPFQADLQGRQLSKIEKNIEKLGTFSDEEAKRYLDTNEEEFFQYLYYTCAKYIQKLDEPKYSDFMEILNCEDEGVQLENFDQYFRKTENVKRIQNVFPIIITTCISAHKLGNPEKMFDMVIMDEASQCNTAVSLVPILRGENLMLVGDPQQLNPVIVLDELVNQQLRKKYQVADEYDYRKNSVYKTYLACDSVSDETLLRNHYRCNKKIIDFNNKKYYNSKLVIKTKSQEQQPLVYVDIVHSKSDIKNAAPLEAEKVVEYALFHKDKTIGVITPFVNQRKLIEEMAAYAKLDNISLGTVHAFQGDEKDVILFSTAITDQTSQGTYDWLKNNKELINVATSRAKDKLIVLSSMDNVERLHKEESDDLYELIRYVKENGESEVTQKHANSRALGVKPFSTTTESVFLQTLNHALENIWLSQNKFVIHKEVAISHVFKDNTDYESLFYMGRFDFVVYEKRDLMEYPVLAIELDGKEHYEDAVVKARDSKKNEICKSHNLQIIRVENSYARRYNYIKDILMDYFSRMH